MKSRLAFLLLAVFLVVAPSPGQIADTDLVTVTDPVTGDESHPFSDVRNAILAGGSTTISLAEQSADPTDPAEGNAVIWQSDGTASGNDGDVLAKVQAGGNIVSRVLIDFEPTTVTATSATITVFEKIILVDDDSAGSTVTLNLPPAADARGVEFHFKKIGATASVTIDPNGAELIDGASTASLTTQFEAIKVVSNGTSYFIF